MTEGYCKSCGYSLIGLSENRCPECGRAGQANRVTRIKITAKPVAKAD